MTDRTLTRRELNRALLARQLLLERRRMPVTRAVERLAGLQAQYTPSPYLSLWTRLEGFRLDDLTKTLERRQLVKALLMRGTLHIVTTGDYWAFATARRDLGAAIWPPAYERLLPRARLAAFAELALPALRERPQTFKALLAVLAPHAPDGVTPTFIWRRVQGHSYVVQVPPSGTWGYHKEGVYRAADAWIPGDPPATEDAFDQLVERYLEAFGPATKKDIAQWAGLPRLTPIATSLERIETRTFRDERDQVLYDVPNAPLPDPATPAPARLVPRFDNLVLSHHDRTRILGDVPVSKIVTKNAIVHATFLVDGFVAGTWNLERGRVVFEPFRRVDTATRRALDEEAERLAAFTRE